MAQVTAGQVLREARERKGYELDTVARRLRIRPDILRAIEADDFAAMPPRGYARNMINAYARLLGLNSTEIVNMYLDEIYAHQVEQARGSSSSGFNMERTPRRAKARNRAMRFDDLMPQQNQRSTTQQHRTSSGTGSYLRRDLYDDRTEFSRDDYGVARERNASAARGSRSERDFLSHHSGYASSGYSYPRQSSVSRGGRDIHVGQTPMHYTASRVPKFLQSRVVVILAVLLVIAIVAVAAITVLGKGPQVKEDDVSQLPVSGINDTTQSDDDAQEESTPVEVAPTCARVMYSVKTGDECYVEIYDNSDDVTALMLYGPEESSFEVTGTWTITTWSPETITVTVDGTVVTLESNENYGGMYAYTVDFPVILEQWRQAHPSRSEQRSAAVAAATTASDSADSSSGSASANA